MTAHYSNNQNHASSFKTHTLSYFLTEPHTSNGKNSKNYYMSMIIAAVIAAVALLALIIVTGLYLKRTTTYKAIISGDRKSHKASFTNRAFKVKTDRDKVRA